MREIFVDTSAWMAIADSGDPNHGRAIAFQHDLVGSCRLLVTDYVLDELYTLVLFDLGYDAAVQWKRRLDQLCQGGVLEVVWVDDSLAEQAWRVFERFNRDMRWSFTDCVSYQLMTLRGIDEAFAFDRHFDQMGFLRRPQG